MLWDEQRALSLPYFLTLPISNKKKSIGLPIFQLNFMYKNYIVIRGIVVIHMESGEWRVDLMLTISELYPVPAEIKKLHFFLGDWEVEGTLKTGEIKMRLEGKWNFSTAAGG